MQGNEAREIYEGMSEAERRCLISLLTSEYVISFPYYSKVLLQAAVAGAGPFTYTITQGAEVRAFSYAFDAQTAVTGGFPANFVASRAETNLAKPQETNSGESVEIYGLAIKPCPAFVRDNGGVFQTDLLSDSRWLALLDDAISVSLQLNAGREGYWLGNISMVPGAGGLEGAGYDSLGTQPLDGGRPSFGFTTNGRPETDNYFAMPEGMVWLPAGRRDSMLNVRFRAERNIIGNSGGNIDNTAADEAAAAGVRGYTQPTNLGAALMVYLKGKTVSKRSMVS